MAFWNSMTVSSWPCWGEPGQWLAAREAVRGPTFCPSAPTRRSEVQGPGQWAAQTRTSRTTRPHGRTRSLRPPESWRRRRAALASHPQTQHTPCYLLGLGPASRRPCPAHSGRTDTRTRPRCCPHCSDTPPGVTPRKTLWSPPAAPGDPGHWCETQPEAWWHHQHLILQGRCGWAWTRSGPRARTSRVPRQPPLGGRSGHSGFGQPGLTPRPRAWPQWVPAPHTPPAPPVGISASLPGGEGHAT